MKWVHKVSSGNEELVLLTTTFPPFRETALCNGCSPFKKVNKPVYTVSAAPQDWRNFSMLRQAHVRRPFTGLTTNDWIHSPDAKRLVMIWDILETNKFESPKRRLIPRFLSVFASLADRAKPFLTRMYIVLPPTRTGTGLHKSGSRMTDVNPRTHVSCHELREVSSLKRASSTKAKPRFLLTCFILVLIWLVPIWIKSKVRWQLLHSLDASLASWPIWSVVV